MEKKVIDFKNKIQVKLGDTPVENVLSNVLDNADSLEMIVVLGVSKEGEFQAWASGRDEDVQKWIMMAEVWKTRWMTTFL